MSNLLNIVCIALSIYYVSSAPRPQQNPTLQDIIQELGQLNETLHLVPQDYEQMPMLHSNSRKKDVSLEEVVCRAKRSFEAVKNDTKQILKSLKAITIYISSKEIDCTQFAHHHENTEDMRTFTGNLLRVLKNHNIKVPKS